VEWGLERRAAILNPVLVMGGLLLAALLVGLTVVRPVWMLVAVVVVAILVPVELSMHPAGLPRIGPTRIVLGAFVLGWAVRELLRRAGVGVREAGDRRTIRPPLGVLAALSLYSGAALLSTLLSIDRVKSFYSLTDIGVQLVFFAVFLYWLRRPGVWRRVRVGLYVAAVVVCLFALFEFVTKSNPLLVLHPGEAPAYRAGMLRVRSTFYHPIALGCFLNFVFPFAVVDLRKTSRFGARLTLGAFLSLVVVVTFLTISRSPIIALLMQAGLFIALWSIERPLRIVVAGAAAMVVVGGLLIAAANVGPVRDAVVEVADVPWLGSGEVNQASSEYYRIALLTGVLNRLSGPRWLYGFGPGTFQNAGVQVTYAGDQHVLTAADSQYVKVLLELGLTGLVAFCLLLAAAVWLGWQAVRRSWGDRRWLALAATSAMMAFVFENITVSMFSVYALGMLSWMSVAISATVAGEAAAEASERRAPRGFVPSRGMAPAPRSLAEL